MKEINLLLVILFTTLLTGCTKEESVINDGVENETNKGTQMQLTVAMPENENPSPSSRLALNVGDAETPLNVELTWKVGDKIYLIFVEGGQVKGKQTVELKSENITNYSKKASFSFTIPAGIGDTFDLYGVHGGGGFVDESSYTLKLPTAAQSTGRSLAELSNNNAVMLKFAQTGISKASPSVSVSFAHIGSLFRISLKTKDRVISDITKAELYSKSAIQVHKNSGLATYSPVNGAISGTSTNENTLAFNIPADIIDTFNPLEFWGWFIPESNENWPWLGLKLTYNNGASVIATPNFKEARTTPLVAGKTYHLYVSYRELKDTNNNVLSRFLKFTNSAGTDVENKFTDPRDNNEYKTVLIGNQFWLGENLRYLPLVNIPNDISSTNVNRVVNADSKFYYVYDNSITYVEAPKNTLEYKQLGVLYNWPAAQTACPEGWHLPNYNEWVELYSYLGGIEVAGGKLKSIANWDSENVGASNSSDFNARSGGQLNCVPVVAGSPSAGYNSVEFADRNKKGYWWSALSGDAWSLSYDDAKLHRLNDIDHQRGFSVRCVRD